MKENLEGFRASKKQRSEDEEHQSLELHSNDDYYEEEEPPGYKDKGKQAPEEVYLKIKENMKWHRTGRRGRRPEGKEIAAFYMHSENDDDDDEEELMNGRSKEKLAIDDKSLITSSGKAIKKRLRGRSPGSGTSGFEAPLKRSKLDSVFAMTPKSQTPSSYKQVKLKTDIIEDAPNLFKLLDKVVEEVGEENVVQVITENTASYKAAGKMLEEKRRNLFWTPCAAYCIDKMLEDFMKIKWVRECMEKGQKISKFIYNRTWLLNLMRKEFTGGRELVRVAITRSATSFATLQSLFEHKACLKRMFQSNKWLSSRLSKLEEGNEVEKIVLNPTFWKKMQYVRKSVDPIVQVLQKVDTAEGLPMPSIYHDMYRAKLAIKAIHGDDERKYGPFWCVIANHWNSLFHHPLYMAAYFLNPSYRYRSDFIAHPEVIRGLNECIVRLEPDNGRRISASMQISEFVSAKADFGTELAISTRTGLDPASWWQQHGINCLELQRIATRILSQTCSSFGCEHNWSTFDQIHSRRRNRLAQKRLNDLVYVHYNLRLRERQLRGKPDDSISVDSVLSESLDDWVVETEKPAFQEDEEIFYNEMEQEADENEMNGNEELEAIARKDPILATALAEVVEPLGVHPVTMVAATDDDDDDDLDFLDDELSD
ncbi:hypothetical protein MRB53_028946 [Persea americana]|uniref:Uncharacterized protein n=1 Tax=Persea americana TaxID=3435 RepID=A0ACC2KHE6_PERAE|nr:hypothetical protein MRB53_028946 [Persea americana]